MPERLETRLDGLVLLEPEVHGDERGFLVETFSADAWAELGVDVEFVQDNHSRSGAGILRGLHFQTAPGQAKLVRCVRGRIWDVAVDLRRDSPTYGQWEGYELDDERHRQLFVPVGFAHGFCVLSDVADVHYKLSSYYDPATEAGIAWDDPEVGVEWPLADPQVSERDAQRAAARRDRRRAAVLGAAAAPERALGVGALAPVLDPRWRARPRRAGRRCRSRRRARSRSPPRSARKVAVDEHGIAVSLDQLGRLEAACREDLRLEEACARSLAAVEHRRRSSGSPSTRFHSTSSASVASDRARRSPRLKASIRVADREHARCSARPAAPPQRQVGVLAARLSATRRLETSSDCSARGAGDAVAGARRVRRRAAGCRRRLAMTADRRELRSERRVDARSELLEPGLEPRRVRDSGSDRHPRPWSHRARCPVAARSDGRHSNPVDDKLGQRRRTLIAVVGLPRSSYRIGAVHRRSRISPYRAAEPRSVRSIG